ncbi:hypothetical protein [Acidovorax sp. Leaf78]|uniref:hypothetical protein n=1 Tax=unclassified Acidovorax TaxID=2684926 RepID=UPI0006F21ABF|nr:hypothetical protein [Acidovorax sp. Leaf78]KQO24602.1 hypothetical protein ASF16_23245 [Acidovorax sp. Leaf78]
MHTSSPTLALALGGALALTLTACGGGSSSDDTAPPAPAPDTKVTLTGTVVVDQAIRNAVVCLDLNSNSTCDASEPASARTGADGAYTLTYDTAQVSTTQVAAASLIAPMVPGALADANTTIDAADTTEGNTAARYVLRQVPGKSGQINPLTTLVAAGITAGMTEASARSNAALQLAIAPAKIDNYQDDAPTAGVMLDSARSMAKVVAAGLEEGAPLVVGDQQAAVTATAGDLSSFIYADAANYSYRTIDTIAKASGTAGTTLRDVRGGVTAGSPTPASTLYNQAYLTATGWQRCDDTILLQGTVGTPNRNSFCGVLTQVGFTAREDIDTRTMSSVVTALQANAETNTINNNGASTSDLLNAVGTATFPAGSRLHTRYNLSLAQPVFINSIAADARPASEATLEQMITARPASSVVLSTGAGTLSLGISSGPARSLRVAFTGTTSATAGTVQFYECDLNSTQTVISNCTATQTGTYSIATLHGARVMRFAGHAPTTMGHTRSYSEVANAPTIASGSRVFQTRETKTGVDFNFTASRRLNATAWAALRAKLGI